MMFWSTAPQPEMLFQIMSISLDLTDLRAESSDVILAMKQKIISLAELSPYIHLLRKNQIRLQQKFYQSKKMGIGVTHLMYSVKHATILYLVIRYDTECYRLITCYAPLALTLLTTQVITLALKMQSCCARHKIRLYLHSLHIFR